MPSNYPVLPDSRSGAVAYDPGPSGYLEGYEEREGNGFDARRMLTALARYKWLILLVTLLGTAAGFIVASLLAPTYAVQTKLYVDAPPSKAEAAMGPILNPETVPASAWISLLTSYAVLEPVVRELRLNVVPDSPADSAALSSLTLGSRYRPGEYRYQVDDSGRRFTLSTSGGGLVQRGQVGESVGGPAGFDWEPPAGARAPGSEIAFEILSSKGVAADLAGRLTPIMPSQGGNILTLELTGTRPARMAAALNLITERQVELAAELKRASLEEKTKILQDQLAFAASNLRQAEDRLQNFQVQTATVPMASSGAGGAAFGNFFELKMQTEQLRRDRQALQQVLAQARETGSIPQTALELVPSAQSSPELKQALGELIQKQAELRALRVQYTDQHPLVKNVQEQVDVLQQQTIPRLSQSVISSLAQRESQLGGAAGSAGQQLSAIPPQALEQARLQRQAEFAADVYKDLRGRYESARIAAVSSVPDLRILDRASTPGAPREDPRLMAILAGCLGSLGLSLLGVVLFDRFDPKLRYPEQVTDQLGLPILGVIPESGGGHRSKTEGAAAMVEAFRETRLNLVHAYGGTGPLVLTLTSPGSGDGKSFVSSHLALAFAELGHKTLLIDGDTRRGELHRLFQASRKPGLMDHLVGNVSREQIIQSTASSTLDLIACGTRQQNGPELLGSGAMSELIAGLRSRYGVILIDSPPLGAGVDPFVLSTLTSNVLLVVRTGATKRDYAEAKFDLLARLPVRILGAVLNGATPDGAYRYYSYLSGYEAVDESEVVETRQLESV